jgi:hypothetical protein
VAAGAAGIAVTLGGQLLINAVLPPPTPKLNNLSGAGASPTYSIAGTRNVLRPFQPVPRVYGRHRIVVPC